MPCENGGFRAIEGVDVVYGQLCAKKLGGTRENLKYLSADFGYAEGIQTLTSILLLIATSKRHSEFGASS